MKVVSTQYQAAELADLAAIRQFIEETAALLCGEPDPVSDLILAVNEAVTNIILHGYQNQPGYVRVELQLMGNDLEVRLIDRAPNFDPTNVPVPDITLPLNQRPYGGMGVHMMRKFSDALRYQLTPEGENELIFVKKDAI